jgi:hypothetical protein
MDNDPNDVFASKVACDVAAFHGYPVASLSKLLFFLVACLFTHPLAVKSAMKIICLESVVLQLYSIRIYLHRKEKPEIAPFACRLGYCTKCVLFSF